ncbi:endolytic transglycosylase MltG [uncultured Modestobacter sp.]|uniref:endolytic transglycosylase MltG n=1 Tax=uncultured Modestobacter sp. TaxID=380048 RepID=UPI0026029081|nr:endolytic transglycosylase MltG [uncultured Modestobacter sp.]
MTDPTQPRPRGRHAQPDADGTGRSAADMLAAWSSSAVATDTAADATLRPRRGRRSAPDTDAAGVRVLSRPAVDVADVGITGLEATGIANVGLAAAGLDVSAFGIDRPTHGAASTGRGRVGDDGARLRGPALPAAPAARAWAPPTAAAPATAEMPAAPPAVPLLTGDDRSPGDRRLVPPPRPAVEPTIADRVVADRFADTDTDPGWLSAPQRAAADAAPQAAAGSSLAALFTDVPGTSARDRDDEPATEVHGAAQPYAEQRDHRYGDDRYADDRYADDRHHDDRYADDRHHDDRHHDDRHHDDPHHDDPHHDDPGPATGAGVFDQTGGLEVIGGHPEDQHHDDLYDDAHHDDGHGGDSGGGRGRGGGGRGGGGRGGGRRSGGGRKRRGPITVAISLLVLLGIIGGLAFGGLYLWRTINPVAEDYSGTGTGAVEIRVNDGDSLRAIGNTLVEADVIASVEPFADAAAANPAATGIQPGVYGLRSQMSGQAALDLLLDPASRMVTKVTIPEGRTVDQTLQLLADNGGLSLEELQAAAADPAALGLPAYANGLLEGFLFPATYDVEPGQTAVDVLSRMVARTEEVLTELQIPVENRLSVLTEASLVQAEAGSIEDMGKVATVLNNRLADGMKLQLDTTVNYANDKGGITTTAEDRANPSPYNTYYHVGLPPGAINNPGEEALRAVQSPTPGDWRFFVVVDPDTGETRFAATGAEHQQNVLLFQQWLRDNPGN